AQHENFGSEAAGLFASRLRKVRAADAFGKTQIVFNLRTRPRLSTDNIFFNQNRSQTLRRSIDGGAQAGGPRTVDCQIVFGARGIEIPAKLFGDLPYRGTVNS